MDFQKKKNYEIDMCSGSILPKLLQFALPLMLSSMLQLLFNAADIVVVGRYAGDNSMAAVGSNTSFIMLLVNLFIGLSAGANILAARYYGAGDKDSLHQTVHTSMLLSLLSGLFLTAVGVLGSRAILILMQSPPGVRDLAVLYLRIYFLGMPANMIYNFGAALLRAIGDTRRPLYYLSFSGVINVLLNLFFVIVCKLDVAGVAIATVTSQCISAFLVVRCMMDPSSSIRLDLRQLRIDPIKLKQILRIGIPSGLQGMLFSLSNMVIQASVNTFGEIIVAGNTAASNIEGFIYTAMNAFHQATVSATSQNLGAGRYERIQPILIRALGCVLAVGLTLCFCTILLGPQLLGIYSDNPDVIAAGMNRLRIICATYAICGVMDVMVGAIRGLGYSVMPMLVSLAGACGLRLLWVATLFQIPEFHTTQILYLSYPVSWTITVIAHLFCYIWVKRKLPLH